MTRDSNTGPADRSDDRDGATATPDDIIWVQEVLKAVAHDLRNPVNIASQYTHLAKETGDPQQIDRAITALERVDELIESRLASSTAGIDGTGAEHVPLTETVTRAWDCVETNDATLKMNITNDAVTVHADPSHVCTVFENLFRNAIEHSDRTPTIGVGKLSGTPGFFVADTGPGIPEETRDEIFHTGYSTSDSGFGIGLQFVDKICDVYDWRVDVTDSKTGGARFEFTIPEDDWIASN